MIGKTISHYKILEKLGEGGMGIVYKAEDIKLKRIVALKFLPNHLYVSSELNTRLFNEAQITAKLNHPHICTIYDIEEVDEEKFIVMEYVDGVTLRTKIKEKALRIEEAINYAIQIGEALEEAHAQGIIHRDIKPDNIMINSKNQVKVMDFGIAKLKEGLGVTRTMSTSGTVSYMAPEQLSGSRIDGKVDIFSLGILLYEMLTSRLPFRGEHHVAMMYSIMNEEPEPINKYLSEVPSEMLHALNRALEKDPEDRYQNVHDMVIDLRRLKKQTTGTKRQPFAGENFSTDSDQKINALLKTKSLFKKYLVFILLGAAILITLIVLFILPSNSILINPDMNSQAINIPYQDVAEASMSSDGKWVVFPARDESGKYEVYMMNLFDKKVRRITNGSGEFIHTAIISPDVSTIVYTRGAYHRKIYSVSTSSGEEKMIMEGDAIWIRHFFPDGKRILYSKFKDMGSPKFKTELWSSNVDGTEEHLYFVDSIKDFSSWHLSYHLSQDGKKVAWIKNFKGYSELMVRDLEKGTDVQITNNKKNITEAHWTSTGQIIYSSNRSGNWNLWMIDSRGGEPIHLTRGGGSDYIIGISNDDKRILYKLSSFSNHIKIGSLVTGNFVQLTTEELPRGTPKISPSKTKIMFTQQEVNIEGNVHNNIYSMDINGKNIKRITNDNEIKWEPSWSRDEKWITYSAYPYNKNSDSSRIFLIPADGSTKPKLMGFGSYPFWINERKFRYWWKSNTYLHLIDSEVTEKFGADSLASYPILKEKYVFLYDFHKAKLGWWIVDMNSFKESGTKKARFIFKGSIWYDCITDDKFYYVIEPTSPLRCISLPDGKEIPIKPRIGGNNFDVSMDGKVIVWRSQFSRNKFILLDNPFK